MAPRACLSDHGAPRSRSGAGEAALRPERLPLEVELRPGAVPGRTGGGCSEVAALHAVSRALAGQIVQQLERGATWGPCGAGVASSTQKQMGARFLPMALTVSRRGSVLHMPSYPHPLSPPPQADSCCVLSYYVSKEGWLHVLVNTPHAAHADAFGSSRCVRGPRSPVQCAARRSRCCSPQPLLSP